MRVVACGGGIVLDPAHRALLKQRCRVVWLQVDPAEAVRRMRVRGGEPGRERPLLAGADPQARLAQLQREREPLYEEAALVRVPTASRDPSQVADAVLAALGAA